MPRRKNKRHKRNIHRNKQIKKKQIKTAQNNADYIQRIDFLVNIYAQFIANNGKHPKYDDIYMFICEYYSTLKPDSFMSDYLKYIENIDSNNLYTQTHGKCDLKTCGFIQRQYRDRNIYDEDSKSRRKLYFDAKSEESIVIYQMLDGLHVHKFHLIDMGMRIMRCTDNDEGLNETMKGMVNKRETFSKIRNDISNDKHAINYGNKFVTQILNDPEAKVGDEHDNEDEFAQFGFGVRFYYHSYYKHNESIDGQIPGAPHGCIDPGNGTDYVYHTNACQYTFSQWFIDPVWNSMKQEVLNSKDHPISMTQYNNTLKKAEMKLDGMQHRIKGAWPEWALIYSVKPNSAIILNHVLAVMFYTNHTNLSTAFSRSFRKLTKMESDEALKTRHSYYAVWGKFLREAVECFGERSDFIDKNMDFNANNICFGKSYDQTKTLFYHGISCKMLFTKLCIGLRGPFSTTLQYETAVVFASKGAGDGIIITVEPLAKTLITFFDCRCWSDFGYESEMLFLGGIEEVLIVGLTGVGDGKNYDKYMGALAAFHRACISGSSGATPVMTHQEDIIYSLISGIVDEKLLFNDYKHVFNERKRRGINFKQHVPLYIQHQFKYMCDKTVGIVIYFELFKEMIMHRDRDTLIFGYPML
eukprot:919486_1